MKKPLSSSVNRGFLSIELSITLVIIMSAIVYGYPRYSRYMQEMEWNVAASHMTIVGSAAKSYIHDHWHALIKDLQENQKQKQIEKDTQFLIDGGYLPNSFSKENTAGQTYKVVIASDPKATSSPPDNEKFKNKLVAFVLTKGGQAMPYAQLRYISQKMDGAGGYIQDENIATGAFGGWELKLYKDYNIRAEKGHLVAWLSSDVLGTDTQDDDRLYRVEVKGHPELNTMKTHLNMDNHDINHAGTINAKEGNFKDDDQDSITATHNITSEQGWLITQGNNGGWKNRYKEDDGKQQEGGLSITNEGGIQSFNNNSIATAGTLKGGTVHSTNNTIVGGFLQLGSKVELGRLCDQPGLQAIDDSGTLLSCIKHFVGLNWWGWPKNPISMVYIVGNQVGRDSWSFAKCPPRTRLVSGGFEITYVPSWVNPDYGPYESYPDIANNQWKMKSSRLSKVKMRAIAYCANVGGTSH